MSLTAATSQVGLLLIFLIAGAKLNAQCQPSCFDNTSVTVPAVGTTPAGSYAISQIETIDTTTGNVALRIPITKLPPGRGGMTEGLNLVYNSEVYDVNITFKTSADPNSNGLLVPWHELAPVSV
jgi:hypothetical protein